MRSIFTVAAAAMVLMNLVAACYTEDNVELSENGGPVVIIADASTAVSKVVIGLVAEGSGYKYCPSYWAMEGEDLNLSEFVGKARSQDVASSSYTRISESEASFSFTLSEKTASGIYDYVAIYPCSAARTTGTAAAKTGRASFALNPKLAQKPSASSPDPSAIIMTASDLGRSTQAKSLSLNFKHQLAYSKMTIISFPKLPEGESVTTFKISVPQGKYLSGRYWYDYSSDNCVPYEGSLENYVLIDPSQLSPNSTSFTLWWASLPLSMASGDTLSVEATTSTGNVLKAYTILSKDLNLRQGTVSTYTFNWTKFQDKTLKFDFTSLPKGWPSTLVSGSTYKYGDYSFTHYGFNNDTGASKSRCLYNSTSHFLTLNYGGFLSLPVLSGHKLTGIKIVHSASMSSGRRGGVAYSVKNFCDSVEYVTPGGNSSSTWNVSPGSIVELPLMTSLKEHQYYLTCTLGGLGISSLELVYTPDNGVDPGHKKDAFIVGSLNIWLPSARTSKKDAGLAPAEREWEYARYNIRDIIKDGEFDILGVQEASLRVRNDVKTDLSSLDKYSYQYFLHKPSTPDNSSSTGFIYNNKRFSLSDNHQFWLSNTPDVAGSVDPDENTPRSAGCAVFSDRNTGKRYFVMVAHASLNDDANARDVERILAKINEYNTQKLPVIFVGDLNANWSMPMYERLSETMEDSRFAVELASSELKYPGTYNGPKGIIENLKKRPMRIDFIFTKGCSVYDYRVLRNKYQAGSTMQYPSDHCPPAVKCY